MMFPTILPRIICILTLPPESINVKIYIAVILPVVYGCETWSVALREEHRLRVLENRVLREIFGLKRNEVTGVEKTT